MRLLVVEIGPSDSLESLVLVRTQRNLVNCKDVSKCSEQRAFNDTESRQHDLEIKRAGFECKRFKPGITTDQLCDLGQAT